VQAAFSVLFARIAKRKKWPTFLARNGNVKVPVYTVKPGCPNGHCGAKSPLSGRYGFSGVVNK
jgi:hypothetical protein